MADPTRPGELAPLQTAQDAARQLNEARDLVAQAQRVRATRDDVATRLAALHAREERKAAIVHRAVTPANVRDATVGEHELDASVAEEALRLASDVGLRDVPVTVGDLEMVAELAEGSARGAKDAIRLWERWADDWRVVAAWSRADADREMGR